MDYDFGDSDIIGGGRVLLACIRNKNGMLRFNQEVQVHSLVRTHIS
jgi:hypothetical protein